MKATGGFSRAAIGGLIAGLCAAFWCLPVRAQAPGAALDAEVRKRGGEIYASHCAQCHDREFERAPARYILAQMSSESIRLALTEGVMQPQAATLSDADKRSVALFLSGPSVASSRPPLNCASGTSPFDFNEPPPFTGWGLAHDNAHAVSARVAGLNRSDVAKLRLKWALAFPNAVRARSQPTVAGGAILVGSHDGTVFSLDRDTGCARWTFRARAEVRTGIVVSDWKAGDASARPLAYFGDFIGNVYAVDAITGRLAWTQEADPHAAASLGGTPVLFQGRLFVPVSSREAAIAGNPNYACCTFRGSLVAYDARSGSRLWQTYMTDPPMERGTNPKGAKRFGPSGAAIWSTPAVDVKRQRIYVTTGNNYSTPANDKSDAVVALDMATGRIAWVAQVTPNDAWNAGCIAADRSNCPEEDGPDVDLGTGALIATGSDGRDYIVAGQKSGHVHGIAADTGKPVWQTRLGRGGLFGGAHFGIAAAAGRVYVPINDNEDGRRYDDPPRPGLHALDVRTGKALWSVSAPDDCGGKPKCASGMDGAVTVTPDFLLAGSVAGRLRAYDTRSGAVLWTFDTHREFPSVNGDVAQGGSMGGASAPIAHRGLVIANSGYANPVTLVGNALLVFEVPGR